MPQPRSEAAILIARQALSALCLVGVFVFANASVGQESLSANWPMYLGDAGSSQYSALSQVNRENVHLLRRVWEYRSEGGKEAGQIQCNAIIIDGILYGSSPKLKIFALDAATGRERWVFDPFERGTSLGVNRGVAYWKNGSDRRILFTARSYLYALNADTGEMIESFGENGRVDLRAGLGRDVSELYVGSNTPGIVYRNLIIMGTIVSEGLPSAPGHVRAYDIMTGKQEWIFHTIPEPGEFGYESWPPDAWKTAGGTNAWSGFSLDGDRGIVYVPTGSAAYDFFGADRRGDNLFANSLIALKADTGKHLWHFQTVHHDLWDRDLPAPPNLLTVTHAGKRIDAVAQVTKSAYVFLFDRLTGEPLFPIEEVAVPPSDLPGEIASQTQPVPSKPPVFSREVFGEDDVTDISPESHAYVLDRLKRYRTGRQFIPPSREGTIIFPGFDGGGEWGGAAVDPKTGVLYLNASNMPWVLTMVSGPGKDESRGRASGRQAYARHCIYCHGVDRKGDSLGVYPALLNLNMKLTRDEVGNIIRSGREKMPPFPHLRSRELDGLIDFLMGAEDPDDKRKEASPNGNEETKPFFGHTGYNRFVDEEGYPAIKPPWGTLNAIDLNKGEILWKVPLGEFPELTERGIPPTGTENYGGPAVTASGLIFIAATQDRKIRAFDTRNGKILWEADLPAGGYATPSIYAVDGRQFIVIATGGGKMGTEAGDSYIAFALPD
jgi:quinoprotein glucose dehydrogenase